MAISSARPRACGSARSFAQPCSSHLDGPCLLQDWIAQPRSIRIGIRSHALWKGKRLDGAPRQPVFLRSVNGLSGRIRIFLFACFISCRCYTVSLHGCGRRPTRQPC